MQCRRRLGYDQVGEFRSGNLTGIWTYNRRYWVWRSLETTAKLVQDCGMRENEEDWNGRRKRRKTRGEVAVFVRGEKKT